MSKGKENGLFPGWPPFVEFKRDIQKLLSEQNKSLEKDLKTFRESFLSHVAETKKRTSGLDRRISGLEKGQKTIQKLLSNHITDTDKKIDGLSKDIKKLLSK